jgi:cytochrome P450
VALERVALKDTVLPNGKTIPQGSHIMVDCNNLWDPALYPSPDEFDGYRFLRKREAGDKTSQFPQSGPDYVVFGGGRHLCPGRFLASNELKLTVAHILLKYDIRLADGYVSDPMQMGVYQIVDPMARLEVRKR